MCAENIAAHFAAFLHIMTGPSWQWSPTRITCLAPSTIGTMHSGSVAYKQKEVKLNYNRVLSRNKCCVQPVKGLPNKIKNRNFKAKKNRTIFCCIFCIPCLYWFFLQPWATPAWSLHSYKLKRSLTCFFWSDFSFTRIHVCIRKFHLSKDSNNVSLIV